MIVNNKFYTIEISDTNGTILAYSSTAQNFVTQSNTKSALLGIKLLNEEGEGIYLNSNMAESFSITSDKDCYIFNFNNIYNSLCAKVFLRCPDNEQLCYWSCEIANSTGMIIEWIDLPGITCTGSLKKNGGDFEYFWPFGEGCVLDDINIRENNDWFYYRELTYQSNGYNSIYPASVSMQFMAYYNELGGLYMGTHDPAGHIKAFDFYRNEDGICPVIRNYADGALNDYKMEYEVVTGVFEGDWHDAAEIYRTWLEETDILPPKISERTDLPKWYGESPVVALYPIRGTKDKGDMTPNLYYPYENVIPYIDEYSQKLDSKMMALPMHWEGTAPWAPPYVWPPFGGEDQFRAFSDKLHQKNHLLGVYCSGIGWTVHSYLDDIDISDKYKEEYICRTPDDKIVYSRIIGPPIRDGYDMCPHHPDVAQIVKGEIEALADAGCDYTQYFDQNLGGNSCFCYAKNHGHPMGPGKWQTDDMIKIFETATQNIPTSKMLIGCEMSAAEPFIKYLPFNDLRYNVALFCGKAVPAYSYLYHEYINNFMGNQNTIDWIIDMVENPDNILLRIAYSFSAGDMLTICLADKGKIFWGWDVEWDVEAPNQESVCRLIANLNAWRRGFAKKYLHYGRMIKSKKINGTGTYVMERKAGGVLEYPDMFTVTYEAPDKTKALVITNYLHDERKIKFDTSRKIWTNPNDENEFVISDQITISPLSALMVEVK